MTTVLRLLAVSCWLFMSLIFAAATPASASAAAQGDCYPDGCGTTTTTEPAPEPACGVSLEAGVSGVSVVATVTNVPAGGVVRLLLGGNEVARGTNDGGVQSIVAMPSQASGDVVIPFEIPELAPGEYSLVAVGVGFTVTCGGGGLEVLGASSGGTGGGGGGGGGGGAGPLAFTGAEIFGLIALAIALLAAGWYLVRRSRRNTFA